MRPEELKPHTRCTFVGQNPDTNEIEQCARWEGHPKDDGEDGNGHLSYHEVILKMAQAIAEESGFDIDPGSMSNIVLGTRARMWWERLVMVGTGDDDDNLHT